MKDLVKNITGQRVLFGAGIRQSASQILSDLRAAHAIVLSTPNQADMAMELAADLGAQAAGVFTKATMHTPVAVTQEALAHAQSVGADSIVSVGGGSTIGLGKALALRTNMVHVAIPTTYAGSEATPILGQTEDGVKTTLTAAKVLPNAVLYDPELVVSLPRAMTMTSSLNAMAHAVEALYARDRTKKSTEMAISGLQAFISGLPAVSANLSDLGAREATQRGAYACGAVLGQVGMALHHKLCHTLGGTFDLPHAETHAVILPHVIQYNAVVVPELLAPVAEFLGGDAPGTALWDFAQEMQAPLALRDLGMRQAGIDRAIEVALQKPYWNPREITADGLRALLRNAWAGLRPGSA